MVAQGEILKIDFPVGGKPILTENAQMKIIRKEHVLI